MRTRNDVVIVAGVAGLLVAGLGACGGDDDSSGGGGGGGGSYAYHGGTFEGLSIDYFVLPSDEADFVVPADDDPFVLAGGPG